jgi:ABC-type glycerol-3-phosphate transport system permease component
MTTRALRGAPGPVGAGRSLGAELLLLVGMLFTLAPIVYLVWNSLRYTRDLLSGENLDQLTLHNFDTLFSSSGLGYGTLLVNSVAVVTGTVILCVTIGALGAYSLSKYQWPRGVTIAVLGASLFLQLVPPVALVPAFYVILTELSLFNTVTGLILVNTAFNLPFALFLLKVYFDSVPDDLRDAALLDGASDAVAFRRVVLPLAAPGVAAVAILVAILTWNEFLMALSLTSSPDAQTLPVGISTFIGDFAIQYGNLSAAAVVATVPMILFAALAHRRIVSGLTAGAVKG